MKTGKIPVEHMLDARTHNTARCPQCFKPKDRSSPDACVHCGVVFAKIARTSPDNEIAIWDNDYYLR